MACAVGLMAFNEAANIGGALRSILVQEGPHVDLASVIVMASGCTDGTAERAREAGAGDPRVRVIEQATREGKASAITFFLRTVPSADILVIAGGDTRLDPGSLDALLAPFDDPAVGMTGGRPVPVNERRTLMGRVVHALWEMHHEVALESPKLGELVAFRPVVSSLPADTSVDEASIEALVLAKGLRLAYAPDAVVRMKGPSTVSDFLSQRRRIHAGHLRLRRRSRHAVSTLSIRRLLAAAWRSRSRGTDQGTGEELVARVPDRRRRDLPALAAAAVLEAAARGLGAWDERIAHRDHRAWKPIPSTKDLTP